MRNRHGHGKVSLSATHVAVTDGCFLNHSFSKLHSISAVKHTFIFFMSCSFKLNQQSVKSFYHSVIYSMTSKFLILSPVIGSVDKDFFRLYL